MKPSLGVDIEEVKRFGPLIRNKSFLNRIFSKAEIAYCNNKKNKPQHYAVRFAAKEAVWKALSEALGKKRIQISHKEISVKNTLTGKPEVLLPKKYKLLGKKIMISLSHTKAYCVAVAHFRG